MKKNSKKYVIERVRSDLRDDIYDLMTHIGYHALEKDLTESLLKACRLYQDLRTYARDRDIPAKEKQEKKELFAYTIYREMNSILGGFHFNRFQSLSSGILENRMMNDIIDRIDFKKYLEHYNDYLYLKNETDFADFAASKQSRHLEDSVTSAVKKGKVTTALSKAIAKDVVDMLNLKEGYIYMQINESARNKEFDMPEDEQQQYRSLRKVSAVVDGKKCYMILKRSSRNSDKYRYLLTNFGAVILG